MADITLNFAGTPDANPYTPVAPWADAYGTGQVLSGGWRLAASDLGNSALWNTDIPFVSSGVIHMRVSTKVVDNSAFGIYITNSTGDGYVLRVRSGDGVQIFNAVAWDTPTQIGVSEASPVYEVDDVFDFYRDCDTGEMWVIHDGVELIRRTSNIVTDNLRGSLYSRGGRMGLVTYVDESLSPTISINSGNGVRAGSTGNTLIASAGFTPTSGNIGGIAITNIAGTSPNFTFSVPSVTDESNHPFYGAHTAQFTDGVNTPQVTVNYLPRAGYDYVILSGTLDTSIDGVVYEFMPAAQAGDQIAFPSPQVTITSNGSGSTLTSGSFQLEHISTEDDTLRFFNLIVGEGESPRNVNGDITLAGGIASKLSVADYINSRAKLPFIPDSTAPTVSELVADVNELLAAMRSANWFEEDQENV